MHKKTSSKKLQDRARRRHNPLAQSAQEMVEVAPRSRLFWGWDRKVMAVTEDSKVYASGKGPNTNSIGPSILVTIPGDVTPSQAIRLLDDVKESIRMWGWPGDFTTMSRDTAAEYLKNEKQEHKKFRSLMKTVQLEVLQNLLLDENGPMRIDFEDIDRSREFAKLDAIRSRMHGGR